MQKLRQVTQFWHGRGSLEDILQKNVKCTLLGNRYLYDLSRGNQVVGVYQRTKVIWYDTRLGERESERAYQAAQDVQRDNLSPELIHIGYNHDLWTPNDMAQVFMRDPTHRIAFSSVDNFPCFFDKDLAAYWDMIRFASDLTQLMQGNYTKEYKRKVGKAFQKIARKTIPAIEENFRRYGRTSEEVLAMQYITSLANRIQKRKEGYIPYKNNAA